MKFSSLLQSALPSTLLLAALCAPAFCAPALFVPAIFVPAIGAAAAAPPTPADPVQTGDPGQRDYRAHNNEFQLNDIRRRIETSSRQQLQAQPAGELDFEGSPAPLQRSPDADGAADANSRALQSSLHRLSRETREKATGHDREHLIEERLDKDR